MVMLMACLQNRSMHNRSGGVWKIAWTGQGAELALGYCSSCSPSYSISISGLLPVIPSCEDHLLLQKGIFYRMGLVCCLGFCAFEYQFYVHCVWRERVELATVLQQSLISQWVTHTMSWASRGAPSSTHSQRMSTKLMSLLHPPKVPKLSLFKNVDYSVWHGVISQSKRY